MFNQCGVLKASAITTKYNSRISTTGLWQNASILSTPYQYLQLAFREPTKPHHKGSKLQLNFTHSPCVSAISVCKHVNY